MWTDRRSTVDPTVEPVQDVAQRVHAAVAGHLQRESPRRRPRPARGPRPRPATGRRTRAGCARRRPASLSSSGVPSATISPRSSTAIRSANWSASSRYWVVRKTVTPPATSSRMMAHIVCRERGSRPVVGSSRKMIRGSPTSVIARSSRRRMPPLVGGGGARRAASTNPNCSSSSSARRRASPRPRWFRSPIRIRFSRPVSRLSTAENWPVTPIAERTESGLARRGRARRRAAPRRRRRAASRGSATIVVLPAPFGSEQRVDCFLGDGEVDSVEDDDGRRGLAQALKRRWRGMSSRPPDPR